MKRIAIALAIVVLAAGCKKKEPEPQPELLSSAAPEAAVDKAGAGEAAAVAIAVPATEPSEDVLRKLMFEQYEALGKVKDLRLVHPSSGTSARIEPKLYKVVKESCKPRRNLETREETAGSYECDVRIWITLAPGDRNPGEQGARIGVKWDPRQGKWVQG